MLRKIVAEFLQAVDTNKGGDISPAFDKLRGAFAGDQESVESAMVDYIDKRIDKLLLDIGQAKADRDRAEREHADAQARIERLEHQYHALETTALNIANERGMNDGQTSSNDGSLVEAGRTETGDC